MKCISVRIIIFVVIGVFAVLALILFAMQKEETSSETFLPITKDEKNKEGDSRQKEKVFVTDVDMNIDNWQTKETEFFTIKFPKEWYWMESNREKTGYRSYVITNNPDFDIDRYADIGVFTGGRYLFTSESEGVESMPLPLKNSEVVISFNARAISDSGTPQKSIEYGFRSTQEMYKQALCEYISYPNEIPITAHCTFVDEDFQRIQTYFIADERNTVFFSARTRENSLIKENVLKKIAKNLKIEGPF